MSSIIIYDGIPHEIPGSYLLVGIDETGHHLLKDPDFPVLGLGGCAVPVYSYEPLVARPWRELRLKHFAGASPHAAAMSQPAPTQLEAISAFFRSHHFGRFAVVLTDQTHLDTPVPPYHLVAAGVVERIRRLMQHFQCTGVVVFAESSTEGDPLLARAFEGYDLTVTGPSGSSIAPFLKYRLSKKAAEPALEVADFIVQASGGAARVRRRGRDFTSRKDFQAVFHSVAPELSLFIGVDEVRLKKEAT